MSTEEYPRVVTYRLLYGPGLLVKRLLRREGFDTQGPSYIRGASRVCRMRIGVEDDGREARVAELMRRWAPEAYRLDEDEPPRVA
jgi:hypothetical protein